MHYMLGFTIPEVAEQLKITPAYAHKLMTRCMKQARTRYGVKENA
jgi:DNA-directed RNA polymerase specialized sigma24 family protein